MNCAPEPGLPGQNLACPPALKAPVHVPVLLREVLEALAPKPGAVFADGTLGGGGHGAALLRAIGPEGVLYAIDRDGETLDRTVERLGHPLQLRPLHGNFSEVKTLLAGAPPLDGALLDLGVSSFQLDDGDRGFSYHLDAPLDMRMDRSRGLTAAQWLAAVEEETLARALLDFADERWAKRIASVIVRLRKERPLLSTGDLVRAVDQAIPARVRRDDSRHPARRTFQAVRIAVNDEIAPLPDALRDWVEMLKPGGRLCVIAFHSIEDRVVKQVFAGLAQPCTCPSFFPVCACGKKPLVRTLKGFPKRPCAEEIGQNPRARSATLRCVERL